MSFLSKVNIATAIMDLDIKRAFRALLGIETIAAAGSAQTDATALTGMRNVVTAADGTKGVILPVGEIDMAITVVNTVASADLPVYPASGEAINALAANTAFSQMSGTERTYHCDAIGHWYVSNSNEINVLDGVTAGTVTASKAVVVDSNKDISAFRDVAARKITFGTNGAGGTAGTVVLNDGANPGYAVTLKTDAQSAGLTIHYPDPGNIVDSYVALSTAALTAAEVDVLGGVTAGTAAASKAVVLDASKQIDVMDVKPAGTKSDGVVMSALKWVDVAVTAALLDSGGHATVLAGVAGDQYKIRNIILVGGGTNFGAGGDRLIDLTDGTTVWTTIANVDIEAAPSASLMWGNAKVPFLTGTSNVASVSAADIKFQYSGGTTDHVTGSITFSVLLEKVA